MILDKVKANLRNRWGKLGFCLGLFSNIFEFNGLNFSTNKKWRFKV